MRAHLLWLASRLDDDALDHQLFTLKYELMAATNDALKQDLLSGADAIRATKVDVAPEE